MCIRDRYIINVLEPKTWDENGSPEDTEAPYAFRCSSKLSQHISVSYTHLDVYKRQEPLQDMSAWISRR